MTTTIPTMNCKEDNYYDINGENMNSMPADSVLVSDGNMFNKPNNLNEALANQLKTQEKTGDIPPQYHYPTMIIQTQQANVFEQLNYHKNLMIVLVILAMNLFFPGVGTIILGCTQKRKEKCKYICIGISQCILAPFGIGWIWALVTSIRFWIEILG